jgi:hypothetical protein
MIDRDSYLYSPIRKTMRPGIKCMHALVALAFMVRFLRRIIEIKSDLTEREWLFVVEQKSILERDIKLGLQYMNPKNCSKVGLVVLKSILNEIQPVRLIWLKNCWNFKKLTIKR